MHDSDIVNVLAALRTSDEEAEGDPAQDQVGKQSDFLPTTHIKEDRRWRTRTLVPIAGHLVIERLNCRTSHGWHYREVRLWTNDGWGGLGD